MALVTTREKPATKEQTALFTMLEQQSLWAQLRGELRLAVRDFSRNPQAFLRDAFSGEKKDSQRSKRLRNGLAVALVAHLIIGSLIALLSWHTATAEKKSDAPEYVVKEILTFPKEKPIEAKPPRVVAVKSDAELPPIVIPRGDLLKAGGGGQQGTQEPKAAPPTQTLPIPPIVAPDSVPVQSPSIPVPGNLVGPETPPPPPDTPTGSGGNRNASGADKGDRGGTGGGTGQSRGPGQGTGSEAGKLGLPDGVPTGPVEIINFNKFPERTNIVFTYRVRPIVSPAAQENKVYGYVLLEATFNADGTITDIIVRQHLPSMDDEAVAAVKRIKFRPATVKGVPITLRRVPIKVPVNLEAR